MLGEMLTVNAYVVVNQGCPVAMSVLSPDQVEIVCGAPRSQSFDWVMHREALRALVQLGTEALEQMDAALSAGEADSDAAAS